MRTPTAVTLSLVAEQIVVPAPPDIVSSYKGYVDDTYVKYKLNCITSLLTEKP